eukprot:gene13842-19763_t
MRGTSEANAMRNYALELCEARGLKKEECHVDKWQKVVIVTNPFHQWRSYRVFQKAAADAGMKGITFWMAKVSFGWGHRGHGNIVFDAAVDLLDVIRELAAIAYYKWKGYI